LQYAARALGRRLGEYPEMLPTGTGPTPLQWPIDPTVPEQDDRGTHGPERDAGHDRERFLVAVPDVNLAPIRNGTCRA